MWADLTLLHRERQLLLAEIAHHVYEPVPIARDANVLPPHNPLGIGARASHEGSLGFWHAGVGCSIHPLGCLAFAL